MLVESLADGVAEGRAHLQGPEVDGTTTLERVPEGVRVGDLVVAEVIGTDGVDLVARPVGGAA